jgi:hypothetical protein
MQFNVCWTDSRAIFDKFTVIRRRVPVAALAWYRENRTWRQLLRTLHSVARLERPVEYSDCETLSAILDASLARLRYAHLSLFWEYSMNRIVTTLEYNLHLGLVGDRHRSLCSVFNGRRPNELAIIPILESGYLPHENTLENKAELKHPNVIDWPLSLTCLSPASVQGLRLSTRRFLKTLINLLRVVTTNYLVTFCAWRQTT